MVDFSSLKCITLRYHPPKCLLDAKANNYPYLEYFAILLTSELETWADQQRAETPDTLGRPVLKQGCFMGKYFSFYRFPWKTLLLEAVQQVKKAFFGMGNGMGWEMFTCVSTTVTQGSVLGSTLLIIFLRQLIMP